jgi:hypothetical protein
MGRGTSNVEQLSCFQDTPLFHPAATTANPAQIRRFVMASRLMLSRQRRIPMALQNIRQKSAAAAGVIGLGALLVGCGTNAAPGSQAQAFGAAGAAAPVSVACEPNQRAIIRQAAVNGLLQSQVQCETVAGYVGTSGGFAATPVAYQPGFQPVSYTQPAALEPTRIVRTAYPQQVVTREVAPRTTSYQRAPERVIVRQPTRSVKKSAVIIGSSAGVGAGIGAAVGGKKGAGIGALIGGGGAALWDQITRRK